MEIFAMPIVEVAISVIIAWALFAIFCSMVQEALVQIKSERGRFFKKYILQQLLDAPNQINWGSLLYTHSTVELLSRADNKPASEITPKMFSDALIEILANSHIVQARKLSDPNYTRKYQHDLLDDFAYATTVLLPSNIVSLLKSALHKAELKAGNAAFPDEDSIYTALVEEISQWYMQLCGRTSLWYGKVTKSRLFFLGLALSIALNIDSVALFRYFNDNPSARKGMIVFYEKNRDYLEQLSQKYDRQADTINTNKPETARPDSVATDSVALKKIRASIAHDSVRLDSIRQDITYFKTKIDSLVKENQLPIGWDFQKTGPKEKLKKGPAKTPAVVATGKTPENKIVAVLLKLLGFLISAFAASLGSPFWFRLLNKANPIKSKK